MTHKKGTYQELFDKGVKFTTDVMTHNEAIDAFTKAIELKPDYAEAYYNRGLVYSKMYASSLQAINDFTKAIELKPDYTEAYSKRGHIYIKDAPNYAQAIDDYTKAISLRPDYAEAYNYRGVAYGKTGDDVKRYSSPFADVSVTKANADAYYLKAIQDFEKAIELKPDYAEAYYNRGKVLFRKNKTGKSKKGMDDIKKSARLGFEWAQNELRFTGIEW